MNLNDWATRWNVPAEAVADLREQLGQTDTDPKEPRAAINEADVQALVRLEASAKGCRLWRNNVGATYTADGSFIRYGLCNESEKMNRAIKSADLIGIRPLWITKHHVGRMVGQFVAREVKRPGWQYTGSAREQAQLKFLELVLSLGGDAGFANKEGTL